MDKLRQYYETLGIKPGASLDEIKQAYRDAVSVWHPDRFANNERLQKKAQEKLKEINEANEKLNAFFRDYGNPNFSDTNKTTDNTYQAKSNNSNNQSPPKGPTNPPPNPSGPTQSQWPQSNKGSFWSCKPMRYFYAVIACFVVLVLAAAIKGALGWGPIEGGAIPALLITCSVFGTWYIITQEDDSWIAFFIGVLVVGIAGIIIIPQINIKALVPSRFTNVSGKPPKLPDGFVEPYVVKTPLVPEGFVDYVPPKPVEFDPFLMTAQPSTGFIIEKDVVTDTRRGLMWARNGNIAGRKMTWNEAGAFVRNLNIGGYNDWRMPTKEELEAFTKRGGYRPYEWLNANGFDSIQTTSYWTSSISGTNPNGSQIPWHLSMLDGQISDNIYDDLFTSTDGKYGYYAWPVRNVR